MLKNILREVSGWHKSLDLKKCSTEPSKKEDEV